MGKRDSREEWKDFIIFSAINLVLTTKKNLYLEIVMSYHALRTGIIRLESQAREIGSSIMEIMMEVNESKSNNPKSTKVLFVISESKETGTGHQRSSLGHSIMTQKKITQEKDSIKICIRNPTNIQCPQSSATLKTRTGQTEIMADITYVRRQESPMLIATTVTLIAIEKQLMMFSSNNHTAIGQRLTSTRKDPIKD